MLEVQVLRYENPSNRDFEGRCCDVPCEDSCDVSFTFCAQAYGSSNFSAICHYGHYTTIGYPISNGNASFPVGSTIAGSTVPNPMVFTSTAVSDSVIAA